MSAANSSGRGFPILGVLAVVFVTLKLTHTIDWSWWWVTSPIWGAFALIGAAVAVVLAGMVIAFAFGWRR